LKYIGDAIMALFTDYHKGNISETAADRAVKAALEMRQELGEYNIHRNKQGFKAIDFGLGINTGPLMLGTVGSSNRLETTVIGTTVNLASRLESLTTFYYAKLVISDLTYRQLTKRDSLLAREIDSVAVKGMDEPVVVYEVFQCDDEKTKDLKQQTQSDFSMGVIQCKAREFEAAISYFQKVLNVNSGDRMARLYVQRCDEYILNPPDEEWKGVVHLRQK